MAYKPLFYSFLICPALFLLAGFVWLARAEGEDSTQDAMFRKNMVRDQIRARGVRDARVLAAMRRVPRHLFVPVNARGAAYADRPVPIAAGQTISQPYIVGLMTELLALKGDERVLEIGTGSGYQAAVLAELCRHVYTVEIVPELAQGAQGLLARLGYANISVRCGDGYAGWPEEAPFDAIMVTCAPAQIPVELLRQLADGGRLVIPVGESAQELKLVVRSGAGFKEQSIIPVRFVPMVKP